MATPRKWGSELVLNSAGGPQLNPTLIALPNGQFVAGWEELGSFPLGQGTGTDITLRFFNADGSYATNQLLVNSTLPFNQHKPVISNLAGSGFVAVWRNDGGVNGNRVPNLQTQVFDSTGTKVGAELTLVTGDFDTLTYPAVTGLISGGFVMIWHEGSNSGPDTSRLAVRGQMFNPDGSTASGSFLVNQIVTDNQMLPSITALQSGGFVAVWTDDGPFVNGVGIGTIRAQKFNDQGVRVGSEIQVNSVTAGYQYFTSVDALASGGFVAAWVDEASNILGGDLDLSSIAAQVFDASGAAIGGQILVNTTTKGIQIDPVIAGLPDGRFVVAWDDQSRTGGDTDGRAIRAQLFNANGSKSGTEFLVNTTITSSQFEPAITVLADGRFVIGWQDFSGNNGAAFSDIRAQIFDPREAAVNLTGGATADMYIGTRFADTLSGLGGNDVLNGAGGNDTLNGGLGNDRLLGSTGADRMLGGAGKDVLIGGAGNDVLIGGTGADRFVFAAGGQRDVITDFTDGVDKIDLSTFNFASFAAAQAAFAASGADLVLSVAGDVLTVRNFTLTELTAGDLIL